MSDFQTKHSSPVFLRFASGDDAGVITGYASTFNDKPDSYGDVVAPGAFQKSLAKHASDNTRPAMLWQHNSDWPIGRWMSLSEDQSGLRAVGKINLDTSAGRDAYALFKSGDLTGLSIGYRIPPGGREPLKAGGNGRFLLKEIGLVEVSLVTLPANNSARVDNVKSLGSRRDLERLLHEKAGLSRQAAAKIAAGGWPALAAESSSNHSDNAERIIAAAKRLGKLA